MNVVGLQHISQKFRQKGITSLAAFSDLDESRLNDLGIHNPEERAKLITAAQMISDFEGV